MRTLSHPLSRLTIAALMLGPLLLTGCPDTSPSTGECTGSLQGSPVTLPMDPEGSHFYRDDDILLDDDGPYALSYGGGTAVFGGVFDDMPTDAYLGTHSLPDEYVTLYVEQPAELLYDTATMNLTRASWDRVEGSVAFGFADGSALGCTFDLRRAFELDTDD